MPRDRSDPDRPVRPNRVWTPSPGEGGNALPGEGFPLPWEGVLTLGWPDLADLGTGS